MIRPSREEMFMQVAHVVKQRATCLRAQVGCVITDLEGTSIRSMGYNGNARGLSDTCDTAEPGSCGCLHAEENALLKAPYGRGLVMYTTTSPCLMCAKRILNSSITQVFYDEAYRDRAGMDLLNRQGLATSQLNGISWWQDQIFTVKNENSRLKASRQLVDAALMSFVRMFLPKSFPTQPGERFRYEFDERTVQAVQEHTVQATVSDEQHRRLIVEVR